MLARSVDPPAAFPYTRALPCKKKRVLLGEKKNGLKR
jgi:hypothetical protein